MVEIRALRLDAPDDWTLRLNDESEVRWDTPRGDIASLHFFALPPDLPGPLTDLTPIRARYREQLAPVEGGLVEVERADNLAVAALRTIFKIPRQPSGMLYVASYTLPFRDVSYVIKFQCPETGITGVRDTAVFAARMDELDLDEDGIPGNWSRDPYDPDYDRPVLRNLADDERHDAEFPDNPLSRARQYLRDVPGRLTFDEALRTLARFEG